MTGGKHTVHGDRSFTVSLLRNLAAGAALVALVATAFWGIGRVQRYAGDPVVDVIPDSLTLEPPPAAFAPPDATESGALLAPVTSEPSPSPSPNPTSASSPTSPSVAPAQISVQVLDAAGDGGKRARAAMRRLGADGYNIVASGRASRLYKRTTVFYSPGHEAEARQVAAAYGFASVGPKPSNLSKSVDLHLLIGQDYRVA